MTRIRTLKSRYGGAILTYAEANKQVIFDYFKKEQICLKGPGLTVFLGIRRMHRKVIFDITTGLM